MIRKLYYLIPLMASLTYAQENYAVEKKGPLKLLQIAMVHSDSLDLAYEKMVREFPIRRLEETIVNEELEFIKSKEENE